MWKTHIVALSCTDALGLSNDERRITDDCRAVHWASAFQPVQGTFQERSGQIEVVRTTWPDSLARRILVVAIRDRPRRNDSTEAPEGHVSDSAGKRLRDGGPFVNVICMWEDSVCLGCQGNPWRVHRGRQAWCEQSAGLLVGELNPAVRHLEQ